MTPPDRPLGPCEGLFWLADQVAPFNFVVALEVHGELDPDLLRRGLTQLQQRHSLLSVGIRGGRFNPVYTQEGVGPLPLRVEDVPWEGRGAELERELNTRLPASRARWPASSSSATRPRARPCW